jgi:hypothetical protein
LIDNKKNAVIHAVKKECKLSDEEYRNILKESAGVTSSKELDDAGFKKVMNYFMRTLYFKKEKNGITLKQKMFIEGLKSDLKWDNDHFKNYLNKYYHIEKIENIDKITASHIIISMKNIYKNKHLT